MQSLPFVKAPKARPTRQVGNADTGILEMAVFGGLTVGESASITQQLSGQQSSFEKGAQIAEAISKEEGISLTEAFSIIEASLSGQQLEEAAAVIRTKHLAAIQEVGLVYAEAGQRNMEATVTALIQSRCAMSEWSVTDTQKMPRALFNDIWDLAQDEIEAEENPSAPPTEEELGKPPVGSSPPTRTGKQSSGS